MGLGNNAICRKCSTEEETSVHILCECVRPRLHSDIHIWVPEDIRKLSIGATWNFGKGTGLL